MSRLSEALESCLLWDLESLPGAPRVIEKIHIGLSNDSYRLGWADQRFVLRLTRPDTELLVNRDLEVEILELAQKANLTPSVIYSDVTKGVLVTRYVEGRHWTVTEAYEMGNLARLATLLRSVHALPTVQVKLEPEQAAEAYLLQMQDNKQTCPVADGVREQMECIMRQSRERDFKPVLCHNDLTLHNLLDTGDRLLALDWEYAAMGDCLFDIAVIAHNHQLGADQIQYLLRCYFGEWNERFSIEFGWAMAIYLYLDCLWYGVRGRGGTVDEFASLARSKAHQLEHFLKDLP